MFHFLCRRIWHYNVFGFYCLVLPQTKSVLYFDYMPKINELRRNYGSNEHEACRLYETIKADLVRRERKCGIRKISVNNRL